MKDNDLDDPKGLFTCGLENSEFKFDELNFWFASSLFETIKYNMYTSRILELEYTWYCFYFLKESMDGPF